MLVPGPGCHVDPANSTPCDLIRKNEETKPAASPDRVVASGRPKAQAVAACETNADTNLEAEIEPVKPAPSLTPEELLKVLDDYIAALAGITKAQDRADFDNAAATVSAAIGALAEAVPAYGAAASPVVKASSNAVLWLVGQDLDYRRLQELQMATAAACKPIRVLAEALGVVLEGQRKVRLRGLHDILALKIQAANIARTEPHATDQTYAVAVDDAQAAANTFQAVRAADPRGAAQALSDAHDALVVAVRNNDGQFAALVISLQTFAQQADDLANAADGNITLLGKKS